MNSDASPRAAPLRDSLTASSRSRINASAPVAGPLASFLSSSAGMNSSERTGSGLRLRPAPHQELSPAFGDELAALVVALVQQLQYAGIGPRPALARAH